MDTDHFCMRHGLPLYVKYIEEVDVSATQIDIDDDALAEAMRLSQAKTKKETVNLALREYAERRRRTEDRLRHFQAAQRWDEEAFWQQRELDKGAS